MKDGNLQNLGAVETKLLYTLHWIILDAAEECADADFEKGVYQTSTFYYLFTIPTITVSELIILIIRNKSFNFVALRISFRSYL